MTALFFLERKKNFYRKTVFSWIIKAISNTPYLYSSGKFSMYLHFG